jgi:hypothetical protein
MASSSIPPAPPPPPPLQPTPTVLARSERPPANRNNIGSIRPTENPPNRSLLANIHPETLQHAAANLRKTQHNQSLFTPQSEQLLGRSIELSSGGYRPDNSINDPIQSNLARTPIYATSANSNPSMPISNDSINSYSLNRAATLTPEASSKTSKWTTSYGQPLVYSSPKPSSNNINNNNKNYSTISSSSSSTTYQQPQQPQTTSYSYSFSSSDVAPPDYPPPPPPPQATSYAKDISPPSKPSTNFYSSTYSTTTESTNNSSSSIPPSTPSQQIYQQPTNNGSYSTPSSAAYISNPQSYIHEFATKTPAAEIDPTLISQQTHVLKPKQPLTFAEQLRDSGLTDRQKYANQFQRSNLPERLPPQAVAHIYQETTANTEKQLSHRRQQPEYPSSHASKVDEVDELIKTMEWKMRTGSTNDICSKCQKEIAGDTPGVTARGKPYHVLCFCCDQCQKQLAGCSFYSVDGKNLCQVDYMNSLDKCDKCATPITEKILRAMGKAFHPECFACPSCTKTLDGIPFTVDPQGTPYCLDCYHERFSPRCAICLKAIVPQAGQTEVARIIAMDRSYHLTCYKCEDCGLQLNSKIEGQGCYPLENHLFCKNCNINRLKNKH